MRPPTAPFVLHNLDTLGYREDPFVPQRVFSQWSVCYLISGEFLLESEDVALHVKGHEFVFVPPEVPFRICWYRDSIGYMGGFSLSSVKDRGHRLLQMRQAFRVQVPLADQGLTDELLYKLFRDQQSSSLVWGLLEALLTMLDANMPSTSDDANRIGIRYLDLIFAPDAQLRSVESAAEQLGVTANSLNRSVRRYTGRTAGEWLAIARISRARALLRGTLMPIIDIASAVGLDDQSYFSRFFRRETGLTPTQYRNKKS